MGHMHRAFAAWLSQQPWRAAVIAACLGVLSPQGLTPFAAAAGAVPAFVALRSGVRNAYSSAAAGFAAVLTSLLIAGQSPTLAVCFGLAIFAVPLALLIVVSLYAVLDRPALIWERLLNQVAELLQGSVEIEPALLAGWARTMWGTYLALWLLNTLCAVFLARWWQALLDAPGGFGSEFRQLRLGKALGLVSVALILTAALADYNLVDSLAWLAITALAFQGLAAAHRQKASGRMKRSWLVAIYVFLIMPFFSFLAVSVLAGWGLADNWRRFKTGEV